MNSFPDISCRNTPANAPETPHMQHRCNSTPAVAAEKRSDFHDESGKETADNRLHSLLPQRHMRHLQQRHRQRAAGDVRLLLRHHRHAALRHEHRQHGRFVRSGPAALENRHAQHRRAAVLRLFPRLSDDDRLRRRGVPDARVLHRRPRQGLHDQHLHRHGRRQQPRPHPRHEHHARLLCLRRADLPVRTSSPSRSTSCAAKSSGC